VDFKIGGARASAVLGFIFKNCQLHLSARSSLAGGIRLKATGFLKRSTSIKNEGRFKGSVQPVGGCGKACWASSGWNDG